MTVSGSVAQTMYAHSRYTGCAVQCSANAPCMDMTDLRVTLGSSDLQIFCTTIVPGDGCVVLRQ